MKKTLLFALFCSLGLLVTSYLMQNADVPFSGDETHALKHALQWTNQSQEISDCDDCKWKDSIFLINGCYDIDTVPHYFGDELIPDGYYAITSRKDIYYTLRTLKQCKYKYILLDVALTRLPDGYNDYTDSIIAILSEMDNIVVAKSRNDYQWADKALMDSVGRYVDYKINPEESGFVKFNIMESAALKMYEDITKRKIRKWLFLYTDRYALCRTTIIPSYFLTQDSLFCNSRDWGEQKLYADLSDVAQYGASVYDFDNKIIVIGDFLENDIHQTIAGDMSGALILLNIFLNLEHRYHIVHWWAVIALLVFYFLFSFLIVEGSQLWSKIPFGRKFWNSEIIQMLFECIGWTIIFHCLAVLIYLVCNQVYNPFIPIVWFTIVPKIYVTLTSKIK